jgi:DNA-binding response OmpR family regulator
LTQSGPCPQTGPGDFVNARSLAPPSAPAAAAPGRDGARNVAGTPGGSKKILIADDNRIMADVMRFNFARSGFNVTLAYDGQAALDLAAGGEFDAVVTDYQMPRLNGEQLCSGLRAIERYRRVPIVLCTAKGYELDARRLAEQLGLARIFCKPFSPREIVNTIDELLSQSGRTTAATVRGET